MAGVSEDREEKKRSPLANPAVTLGTNLMTGMLFFSGIGYYLDHRRGDNSQVWTITGMFLGLAWCAYEVWKLVRKGNELLEKRNEESDEPAE